MNLQTTYMGLKLKNPLVGSASLIWDNLDNIRKFEDEGGAAITLFSIFEEQLRQEAADMEHFIHYGEGNDRMQTSNFLDTEEYLELIQQAVQAVDIPIIGSLNGATNGSWTEYARSIESAGAHGIELNIYYMPADPLLDGVIVEQQHLEILKRVKSLVSIPVALKINPMFSSIANMATKFDEAGADALVLFNRLYQPDIDLENLEMATRPSLSDPSEIRLPLMWIANLYGRINASLAASRGIDTSQEIIKYLLAGADVVMTTASLLRHGIEHSRILIQGLEEWMDNREYDSLKDIKGALSHQKKADPSAFERACYVKLLQDFKTLYIN